jgi:DNA polymerase-3 subunit gamma/tau
MVLARRWRPQRFADLIGQDVVVRTLQNSLKNKQMAHAYLLSGIRGTGKTTIARLLAMVVNCEQPDHGEPCGQCTPCTSIASGSNLDVQEMDAASHTGVDDIREILDGVRYPPSTLQHKVYIIDEAHMLSKSAFNALLKTLEEPPERVLFLLATTEAEKLPITVRSRCQRFDLRRLGADEISHYLAQVLGEEKVAYEAEALHAIAHAADGSVRDALSLTERVLAYGGDTLSSEHVRHALGLVGPDIIRRLSDAVLCGNAQIAIDALYAASNGGHAPRSILLGVSELWHDLACMMVDANLLQHEPGEAAQAWLKDRLDCWDTQSLDLRYQVLVQGLRDLMQVDERQAANMLLIRLCALNGISPPRRIPELDTSAPLPRTESKPIEKPLATSTSKETQPAEKQQTEEQASPEAESKMSRQAEAPAQIEASPEPELAATQQVVTYASWEDALEAYGKVRAGVAALLEHVVCLSFGDKVRLALDTHQERAIVAAERLSFAEWLGREVHWEPKADQQGESISVQRARQAEARQQQLEKSAEDDPHVQALKQAFDGKIEAVRAPGAAGSDDIPLEEEAT